MIEGDSEVGEVVVLVEVLEEHQEVEVVLGVEEEEVDFESVNITINNFLFSPSI